jgi:PAS domain S-box-containing protein
VSGFYLTEEIEPGNILDTSKPMEIYHRIFESAPDAQLVVDPAGRIALANAQAESLFGYARTELIGNPVEMLIPQRYHAAHVNHRNGYLAAAHSRPMGEGQDLFGRRKSGEEFPVDIMLSPLQVDKGLFVLCVVRKLSPSRH